MSAALPKIVVSNVTRIFNDGQHNAFTDLFRYRGRFFLGFRANPHSHHILPGSAMVILTSDDGVNWRETLRLPQPGHDPRDIHFFVLNDRLFACFSSWVPSDKPYGYHQWAGLQGFAIHTDDGEHWSPAIPLEGTAKHFIWRCATHAGKAYLCGRRINEQATANHPQQQVVVESAMMESDDGLTWSTIGLFQEEKGNETAFVFEDDGSVVAIARGLPDTLLCRSSPPYQQWTRTSLGRFVGGPMLVKWAGHYLVGGRKFIPSDAAPNHQGRTVLSWLVDDQLQDVVTLPSGGDTGYTGFVPLSDTTGLISWYSSHEGSNDRAAPAAIYTARLSLA